MRKFFFAFMAALVCSFAAFAGGDESPSHSHMLKTYEDLRVADVVDGLDMVGLRDATIL
ncbi:MAG: hypothetical protein R6U46_15305 [Marinilabilia sp.]